MKTYKTLLRIYRTGNYQIGERFHRVENHEIIQNKNLVCDCTNANKTDNQGICIHKLFILNFPILEYYNQIFQEMNNYLKIKKSIEGDSPLLSYTLDKIRDMEMGR